MPTKLIRSLYNIKPIHQKSILTIGKFDGIHLGHQQLIAEIIKNARALGVPSMLITFEPHPEEYFAKEKLTVPRLTRFREKVFACANLGIDYILILPFNQRLADISASDFVTQILQKYLQPTGIIIGDDFHFGHKRQGDYQLLSMLGDKLGFSVSTLPTYLFENKRISSARVREALEAGDLMLAQKLLGHPYTMQGRIRRGDARGRQWGFPTANIYLHRKLSPLSGVYTVLMHGLDKHPHPGVANIGVRPTVDGTRTLLEVHLLDFNKEIYGRYVTVEFCKKLRDEKRYSDIELLKQQIANDVIAARNYFKKQGML